MEARDVDLTFSMITGDVPPTLVEVKDSTKYGTNEPDGYKRVSVAFPGNKYRTHAIKVPNAGVPDEVLKAAPGTPVEFTAPVVSIYKEYLVVKATAVKLSDDDVTIDI